MFTDVNDTLKIKKGLDFVFFLSKFTERAIVQMSYRLKQNKTKQENQINYSVGSNSPLLYPSACHRGDLIPLFSTAA